MGQQTSVAKQAPLGRALKTPLWMQAIEAQLEAFEGIRYLTQRAQDSPTIAKIINEHGFKVDRELLPRAVPYAWSEETTNAVLAASRSIPEDAVLSAGNIDTAACFWYFEQPLPFQTLEVQELALNGVRALNFGWMKFRPDRQPVLAVSAWCDGDKDADFWKITPSQTFIWGQGETLKHALEGSRRAHDDLYGPTGVWKDKPNIGTDAFMLATEGLCRFILAGMAWVDQRVLVLEDGHIERHRRKAFNRATKQDLTAAKVVVLRRRLDTPPSHNEGHKDYSCRWTVDGHWRNQPHGENHSLRRLQWIDPYIKGPDDMPLKVPAYKVYRVDR